MWDVSSWFEFSEPYKINLSNQVNWAIKPKQNVSKKMNNSKDFSHQQLVPYQWSCFQPSIMLSQLKNLTKLLPVVCRSHLPSFNAALRNFSSFLRPQIQQNAISSHQTTLLQPSVNAFNIIRGMKIKGHLRLRCKDCYFVRREQRLYVMCKSKGRHKQMAMKTKPKNTWILTDATQSKLRAW